MGSVESASMDDARYADQHYQHQHHHHVQQAAHHNPPEVTIMAAQRLGMPRSSDSQYHDHAVPISWLALRDDVQNGRWDLSLHGIPVHIKLPGFGAGQILCTRMDAYKNRWHAVIVFDCSGQPTELSEADAAAGLCVNTQYGRIKWGMPWIVRENYVAEVDAVVRSLEPTPDKCNFNVAILKRAHKEARSEIEIIPWDSFVSAARTQNNIWRSAYHHYVIDNALTPNPSLPTPQASISAGFSIRANV